MKRAPDFAALMEAPVCVGCIRGGATLSGSSDEREMSPRLQQALIALSSGDEKSLQAKDRADDEES